MKKYNIEFIKSDTWYKTDYNPLIETNENTIILIWRSNVGKSSFINAFFNKKWLAHTSSKPGKTRLVNHFKVNWKYNVIDLPGYWYARWSRWNTELLTAVLSDFFNRKPMTKEHVFLLIDARRWLLDIDKEMYIYLKELWYRLSVILTKVDLIKQWDIQKIKKEIKDIFLVDWIYNFSIKSAERYTKLLENIILPE